jgi:hypothetical protein
MRFFVDFYYGAKNRAIIERVKKKITPTPDPTAAPNQEILPVAPAAAKKKKRKRKPKLDGLLNEEDKKKEPPPVRVDDEIRSMILTIRAETKMSFKAILKDALRAWHDKLAYLQPLHLKRLSSESLRTLGGRVAEIEQSANKILRKIILARIDPAKKAELADMLDDEIIKLQDLRRTMSREAGIPLTHRLTTDVVLAIGALNEKKQETSLKSDQESYDNVIQLLERYRLDTYEPPEPPKEAIEDNHNLNP